MDLRTETGSPRLLPVWTWFVPALVGIFFVLVSTRSLWSFWMMAGTYGVFALCFWRTGSIAGLQFAAAAAMVLGLVIGMIFQRFGFGHDIKIVAISNTVIGPVGYVVGLGWGLWGALIGPPYATIHSRKVGLALSASALIINALCLMWLSSPYIYVPPNPTVADPSAF